MKAILKITEATGKSWELELASGATYSIGRAQGNDIVLNDRRVSRQHAQVVVENGDYKLIDGYLVGDEIHRSVNRVFVNGMPYFEKNLEPGDLITIGASRLEFEKVKEEKPKTPVTEPEKSREITMPEMPITGVNYDDKPLGHTQLLMSASEIIGRQTSLPGGAKPVTAEELKVLRRKAQILEMFYKMSKTLGTVFDLKEIFVQATDLIFRGTPADRVVALLADETLDRKILDYSLYPIAAKTRDGRGLLATSSAPTMSSSRFTFMSRRMMSAGCVGVSSVFSICPLGLRRVGVDCNFSSAPSLWHSMRTRPSE